MSDERLSLSTSVSSSVSRRRLLATLGLTAGSFPFAGCAGVESKWVTIDGPTDATLTDVVAAATGTYAVGEGGVLLERGRRTWSVGIDNGPTGEENGLRSADVTSNGRVVWFGGDSGALGAYDTVTGETLDVSSPDGRTSSVEAVAVSGLAGSERLLLLDSSGELLRGRRDGAVIEWSSPEPFGTGASVTGLDVTPLGYAYVCDTSGGIYESVNAGETWTRIGIEGASVNFSDIAAVDAGNIDVAGGNGVIYRYDGSSWSQTTITEVPIRSIARDTYDALAVDAEGGTYERTFDGWDELDHIDTGNEPRSIALGTARTPQVAVGESGLILERRY